MTTINITASGTYHITSGMDNDIMLYTNGSVALAGNLVIDYTTPTNLTKVRIFTNCYFTASKGVTITILGKTYSPELFVAANPITIDGVYMGSAWQVYTNGNINAPQLSYDIITPQYLVAATGTSVDLNDTPKTNRYVITGAGVSISSSYIIQHTGTPIQGQEYEFTYNATVTYASACSVTILGRALTQAEAISGNLLIKAIYRSTTWYVTVSAPLTAQSNSFSLVLNNTQTTGLYTTPQLLITGITGYIISIESAFAKKIGTTTYATNVNLVIQSSGAAPSGLFSNAIVLTDTDGIVRRMDVTATTYGQVVNGANMQVAVTTGNPTNADAACGVKVFGTYRYIAV